MRVLWFTNSPVSAKRNVKSNFVGESWIGALERNLTKNENIKLAIAFKSNAKELDSFDIDAVTYFVVPHQPDTLIKKLGFGDSIKTVDEKAVKNYIEVVERFKPDVIQIFGSENNYGLVIPHISVPVIIHIQGNITVYNKKYFSGISAIDMLRYSYWKHILKRISTLQMYYQLLKVEDRERKIFSHCEYFLGRTRWDRNIARVLAPNSNYFHCDEVLRKEFSEKEWKLPGGDTIKLISVIRGHIYKGLETVMETASLLKDLKIKFSWTIVGNSSTDRAPRIFEKKFKKHFSEVNVILAGSKNGPELRDMFLESSIYVHPSHIENSPNAVCEAMIIGLPVIATSVGGTSGILKDSEEGILIQDGDPYAMAGAIIELSGDHLMQKLFSEKARKRALTRHDPQRIVNDLIKIYQDVVANYSKNK